MIEDIQFSTILGLYHGKPAKAVGNPRNFEKLPVNHSIIYGGNEWSELKLSMVLSQTRISVPPPPPLIGDFAKNRKKMKIVRLE